MGRYGIGAKKTTLPGGRKKKTSFDKKAPKEISPLMVDDDASKRSTSSRLDKEKDRASQRKERDEKRKKRDKQLANSSKSKKKKSSKPKLSQEERDAKDSKLGCWHKTKQILVKTVHLIDAAIGLTFLIYGCLINAEFANPAMDAVIATIAFGSTMLFTSIMGAIGFYSSMCSRCGLLLSGYTSPVIALFYLFFIVILLASPETVFGYLEENKDVMYLNDAEILLLKQLLPVFYIGMASLAAIEIIRFIVLRDIRATLLRFDAANKRIHNSLASSKKPSHRSSSKRSSKRSNSSRSGLTEPLMGDEEEGNVSDDDDY
mmetsp:Transcript_14957/g.31761  ORF Transcript_14957/g.31761 Transcript_14957/m.31761 type:complete len:317 (-) Transcript_14957:147-1097(-)|eukprot:CAMPEP_0196135822 /NCGR_PEP_ID=MMETSP0910-20130528/4332_1 /TAXON_ID=49265 /ORGANISM="Thalassiosira rotula, Strain GSO102" /LENGTH=316 /DNA_ID=CAMNT_0041396013 /DNA_START=29 /DNA_END=979 /DNA_ORIENTATION=+